jgi:hypothetical protein
MQSASAIMQGKWVIYCTLNFTSIGAFVATTAMLLKTWHSIEVCNRGPWIAIMCQLFVLFLNNCWFIEVFGRFGEYMQSFMSVIVNWFMFAINIAVFCAEVVFIANWEACESLDALKVVCVIYASVYAVAFGVCAVVMAAVRCTTKVEAA